MKSRMRRKIFTGLGLAVAISCFVSGTVSAETATVDVALLKESDKTDQIILVMGGEGSEAMLSYHEKNSEGVWNKVFSTPAVYGRNGSTADKKEGDGKTPKGTYTFTMAFGLKEDPGSVLSYHRVQKGDYWVDDINSVYYNRLVSTNTTKKAWKSAENMAAQAPYYNYGLALNFNPDCIPGKGSAIFLHCTGTKQDAGSAGCIRIPQERMEQLIRTVDEDTRIIIATDNNDLEFR